MGTSPDAEINGPLVGAVVEVWALSGVSAMAVGDAFAPSEGSREGTWVITTGSPVGRTGDDSLVATALEQETAAATTTTLADRKATRHLRRQPMFTFASPVVELFSLESVGLLINPVDMHGMLGKVGQMQLRP